MVVAQNTVVPCFIDLESQPLQIANWLVGLAQSSDQEGSSDLDQQELESLLSKATEKLGKKDLHGLAGLYLDGFELISKQRYF